MSVGIEAVNPIDTTLSTEGAVTLDECLRRAPKSLTQRDLKHMVTILRAERVAFEIKASQRDARREGIEDDEAVLPLQDQSDAERDAAAAVG